MLQLFAETRSYWQASWVHQTFGNVFSEGMRKALSGVLTFCFTVHVGNQTIVEEIIRLLFESLDALCLPFVLKIIGQTFYSEECQEMSCYISEASHVYLTVIKIVIKLTGQTVFNEQRQDLNLSPV